MVFVAVLVGKDRVGGVQPVSFSILTRRGFAVGGAWAGGGFTVFAIREYLCRRCHMQPHFRLHVNGRGPNLRELAQVGNRAKCGAVIEIGGRKKVENKLYRY